MSFLDITPNVGKISDTVLTSAGYKAAVAAAQRASPRVIQAAQNIFAAAGILDAAFGQPFEDTPLELLGGMAPSDALEIMRRIRALRPSRKNLWFVRLTDSKPPDLGPGLKGVDPLGTLDLLAIDVSYGSNGIQSGKTNVGSAVLDLPNGIEHTDISVTTLDDSAGTLKRWFTAKQQQIAAKDGTFGLPVDYCMTIEIVHGAPAPDTPQEPFAYRSLFKMRAASMQFDLSRRDQGFAELQMTFTQFDTFYPVS